MVPQIPEGKALVVYGRATRTGSGHKGYRVFTKGAGGGPPIITKSELMDIGPQKIELNLWDVQVLSQGSDRKANLTLTANVRFPEDEEGLNVAVENLLHVGHSDVGRMAKNFTEARARAILRRMDIQDATRDLMATAQEIQARVQRDMNAIGVTVKDLTIRELKLRG